MVSGQQHAPAALYPRENPGTHFTGGWVGPKAGLDGRKISSPPGFDSGPSSPKSLAIPTELELELELEFVYMSGVCVFQADKDTDKNSTQQTTVTTPQNKIATYI